MEKQVWLKGQTICWAICLPRNKFHDLLKSLIKWGPLLMRVPDYIYCTISELGFHIIYTLGMTNISDKIKLPKRNLRPFRTENKSSLIPYNIPHRVRALDEPDCPVVLIHSPNSFTWQFSPPRKPFLLFFPPFIFLNQPTFPLPIQFSATWHACLKSASLHFPLAFYT